MDAPLQSLAPGLLIAMPQLEDPNFERAVVLMVTHDADGSFGLVINRETDLSIGDVLGPIGVHWNGDPDAPVDWGGPVTPESGWLLFPGYSDVPVDGVVELTPEISLSSTEEQLRRVASEPPPSFRFLLGYAGWGGGQLDIELARGSWVTAPATADLVFRTPSESIWEASLQSIGVDPAFLVQGFGVH